MGRVNFADGTLPDGPIALAEVQGYVYAALLGAAELAAAMDLATTPTSSPPSRALRERFNAAFWDERGWFAIGLDGEGRIDALTTNPGHALWTGIATRARRRYLDRSMEPAMWTGWGLRTLADSAALRVPGRPRRRPSR